MGTVARPLQYKCGAYLGLWQVIMKIVNWFFGLLGFVGKKFKIPVGFIWKRRMAEFGIITGTLSHHMVAYLLPICRGHHNILS